MGYQDIQTNEEYQAKRRGKRTWGGIILVVIGAFLLLDRMDLAIPSWIVSWQMILIVVGLLVGLKHNFRGGPWLVLMGVGGVFLLLDLDVLDESMLKYIWPVGMIALGAMIILKKDRPHMWRRNYELKDSKQEENVLDCVAIFGSDSRIILNKDLKGGDLTSIFGGIDLNLTQADFADTVSMNVHVVFGGIELVVPPHWDVKLEVHTILGGTDDKRMPELVGHGGATKTLILKGSVIFGGVEIKSYPSS